MPTMPAETPVYLTCTKCSGTGSVSWGIDVMGRPVQRDGQVHDVGRVCFDCGGTGGSWSTVEREERLARRRAQAAARREAKRLAKIDAHWSAFAAAQPEAAAAIEFLVEREHDFGYAARGQVYSFGVEVFPGVVEAAVRIAAEVAEEERRAAEPKPEPVAVVEGRVEIVGEVLGTKVVDGYAYGSSVVKMIVGDDRGFRVYGTAPSALLDGSPLKGRRVAFTAQIEASRDDVDFGFFKRPTKPRFA